VAGPRDHERKGGETKRAPFEIKNAPRPERRREANGLKERNKQNRDY